MCGTAIPINPIGPQKAVATPARRLVERKIKVRAFRIDRPSVAACSCPRSRTLSGRAQRMAISVPMVTPVARIANLLPLTFAMLPMLQMTKCFSACSSLRYCRMLTPEEAAAPSMMPRMRSDPLWRSRIEAASTMSSIAMAPAHAAAAREMGDELAKALPASSEMAAPRLAPLLMPST